MIEEEIEGCEYQCPNCDKFWYDDEDNSAWQFCETCGIDLCLGCEEAHHEYHPVFDPTTFVVVSMEEYRRMR